jgi:hypothetical protein
LPVAKLLLLTLLVPADGLSVTRPRLLRGEELVYHGGVVEAGEKVGNRFRKKHELEVRLFVLEVRDGVADCAVLTCVRPLPDPAVASGAAFATGADPAAKPVPPAVHLDLVRIDTQGRAALLAPPAGPPPIPLGASTRTAIVPPLPTDVPPLIELGMFVPLPAKPSPLGTTWATAETGRPPLLWSAAREGVWNGGRCVEVGVSQQTDGYDRPADAVTGWRRTDTILVMPSDGYACSVKRKTERREGASVVGWVEVGYSLQTLQRHHGARYSDLRREIEMAYWFATEFTPLLATRTGPQAFRALGRKIDDFIKDQPAKTGFREALESVGRRCEAAARGEAVAPTTVAAPKPDPPAVGKAAPDFVAPLVHSAGQFRLSAARGGPAVVVFYNPASKTAAASLTVAEALHQRYAGRAAVVALAISSNAAAANRQREELKLTVPVADGAAVRDLYGVDRYPKVFVVDRAGVLAWQFEGAGSEVGYLVKEQVEKLVK